VQMAASLTRARLYALSAAIASVPLVAQTIRTDWSLDAWQHAAAILELSRHPLDPGHPAVAASVGHPDLSPYSFVWGLVHRVTGADVLSVMVVAGLANLVMIWVGLWMVASRLTRSRFAPALAVPAVLLVWGYEPWRWSGYPSLNSIGFGLPYPSFASFGAYLIAVAVFLDWLRNPCWTRAAVVAALGAGITLTHPITGAALAMSAVILLVEAGIRGRGPNRAALAQLAVPAVVAAMLVIAWPFYSIVSLFDHAGAYSGANTRVLESIVPRAGLALACLPVVVIMARQRRDWRLAALATAPLLFVAAGVVLDDPGLGRFLPFGLLPIQLAVADAVAGAFQPSASRRRARLALGACLAAVGLAGIAAAGPHMVPDPLLPEPLRDDRRLETMRDDVRAVRGLRAGMVVIAPEDEVAWPVLASGAKLVAPPYGAPEVGDNDARRAAVADFLAASAARKRQTIERYGATHVAVSSTALALLEEQMCRSGPGSDARRAGISEPAVRDGSFFVIPIEDLIPEAGRAQSECDSQIEHHRPITPNQSTSQGSSRSISSRERKCAERPVRSLLSAHLLEIQSSERRSATSGLVSCAAGGVAVVS
jgi:hypothetical protein